jgi:hypothetical protein
MVILMGVVLFWIIMMDSLQEDQQGRANFTVNTTESFVGVPNLSKSIINKAQS